MGAEVEKRRVMRGKEPVKVLAVLLCFLGWGVYWVGLPEPSQVGIID